MWLSLLDNKFVLFCFVGYMVRVPQGALSYLCASYLAPKKSLKKFQKHFFMSNLFRIFTM